MICAKICEFLIMAASVTPHIQKHNFISVADVESLALDTGTLSLMTNEEGGIIDDCIVHKSSAGFLNLVCNAGCAEKDFAHITVSWGFRSYNETRTIEVFVWLH